MHIPVHFRIAPSFFAPILLWFLLWHIAADQTLRVMPLGNSETYGWERKPPLYISGYPPTESIGYRYWLWKLFQDTDLTIDFVGPFHNGSLRFFSGNFDPDHAGFSGITTRQLYYLLMNYNQNGPLLIQYPTDVLLIHIGTNDIRQYDSLYDPDINHVPYFHPDDSRFIGSILEYLYSKQPDSTYCFTANNGEPIQVYLAQITGYQIQSSLTEKNIRQFNEEVHSQYEHFIQTHPDERQYVTLVNIHDDATLVYRCKTGTTRKYSDDSLCPWSEDGDFANDALHPIESGYQKIGATWFRAMQNHLNETRLSRRTGVEHTGTGNNRIIRISHNSLSLYTPHDQRMVLSYYDLKGQLIESRTAWCKTGWNTFSLKRLQRLRLLRISSSDGLHSHKIFPAFTR
ncbi:MAG: hypothetical protein JW795_04785 [Chitinivibrionales bacterium]|nr:hypothetical protein [Chitinivibrionales bacterium]